MRYTILGLVLIMAVASAPSAPVIGSDYDLVRPVILAEDWTIPQVALYNRGTIAIGGGQSFRSPDGLMLITPDGAEKLVARRGERVPGSTDKSFARFLQFALDERDNVVFVASVVPCDLSDPSCENSSSASWGDIPVFARQHPSHCTHGRYGAGNQWKAILAPEFGQHL